MEWIKTDIGVLKPANVEYLVRQGVLSIVDGDVFLKDNERRIGDSRIQIFSMFNWVKLDIIKNCNVNGIDEVVSFMRGSTPQAYRMVDNIFNKGWNIYQLRLAEVKAEDKARKGKGRAVSEF
jgi:hypothetical protein